MKLFTELKEKADRCNNVAIFQSIKVEADALKMRLLNEIAQKDEELAKIKPPIGPNPLPKPPKVKNVSIQSVNVGGTWQVKSKAEIDAYIEELRQRLYKEIEADTVLNIEF